MKLDCFFGGNHLGFESQKRSAETTSVNRAAQNQGWGQSLTTSGDSWMVMSLFHDKIYSVTNFVFYLNYIVEECSLTR